MSNTNYAFIYDTVVSQYTFNNEGVYNPVPLISIANNVYDFNVSINTTSLSIQNSSVSFILRSPNSFQVAAGTYYLNANGSWVIVSGGANSGITEIQTANGIGGGTIVSTGTLYIVANTGTFVNSSGLFVNSAYINTISANAASFLGGNTAASLVAYSTAAYANAIADSATDASSKAAIAYSNSVSYTDTKAATAYSNSVTYTDTKAATAYSNAVADAATDASSKAATAYSNAVSTASTDASTKAATAYSNAIATAATDASTKAATAYTNALSSAASLYQTTAGLAANVAILTSNNSLYLGGTAAASFVQNTDSRVLSGNLNFTGVNTYFTSGIYVGANLSVNTSILFIGNSTVNTVINSSALAVNSIYAAGSYGNSNQVLTTNSTGVYWANAAGGSSAFATEFRQQYTANGTQTDFTVTSGYVANQVSVYLNGVLLRNGVDVNVASGTIFSISPAPDNGALIDAIGQSILYANGISTIVSQQFTANGTSNTFTISGGYIPNQVQVYLNGVKQLPTTDVTLSSGNTVNFINIPANNAIVDVYGYQTSVSYSTNNFIVGNVSIGTNLITVGNSSVNTVISNGNISINGANVSAYHFKNKIINGNFDWWQRNTANTAQGYLADRWYIGNTGTTFSASRQTFTLGQTDVPGEPIYFHRVVTTTAAAAGNYCRILQPIEYVKTLAFKTATLSFWAKADASKNISTEFVQNFGTGGSPSSEVTTIGVTTCALTTSWQNTSLGVTPYNNNTLLIYASTDGDGRGKLMQSTSGVPTITLSAEL